MTSSSGKYDVANLWSSNDTSISKINTDDIVATITRCIKEIKDLQGKVDTLEQQKVQASVNSNSTRTSSHRATRNSSPSVGKAKPWDIKKLLANRTVPVTKEFIENALNSEPKRKGYRTVLIQLLGDDIKQFADTASDDDLVSVLVYALNQPKSSERTRYHWELLNKEYTGYTGNDRMRYLTLDTYRRGDDTDSINQMINSTNNR
jgi:hypothetical protein